MANSRFYSNTAQQTTLSGSTSAGATSITVGATTGFPSSFPYTLALDYGAATEELVSVTAAAGTTLTVTRGYGGTSAQSHSLGAVVRHTYDATDATDYRTHEAAAAAVHGVAGTLVGTSDTQTLTNKTLTSPTINGGALSGTFTGSPTLSGNPTFSGVPVLGQALAQRALATDATWRSSVQGDSVDRFYVEAGGKQWWGTGSATADTNLYRATGHTLKTDGTFVAVGNVSAVPTDTALDGLDVNLPTGTVGDLLNLRVNSNIQAAMDSSGSFRIYSGNSANTYTPTWGNTGGAVFSTNSGFYFKIGKIVLVHLHAIVSTAGSGAGIVNVTMPSTVDGTIRQVLTLHGETVGANGNASGTIRGGECVKFAGSSSATMDRLRVDSASTPVAREDNILGADLIIGATLTIQGWYREA